VGIVGRPHVSLGNSGVASSRPKPSIDVNGLKVLSVTAFALEVALASGGVDGAHVV
jgi:hypothetical protein